MKVPGSIASFAGLTIAAMLFDIYVALWGPEQKPDEQIWPFWVDILIAVVLSGVFLWLITWRRSETARMILLALIGLIVLLMGWMAFDPSSVEPIFDDGWDAASVVLGIASVLPLLLPSARRWCTEPRIRVEGVFD